MIDHFKNFEEMIFTGEFFQFTGNFPDSIRAPDSIPQRLIISFLDILYGVQPVLAYEQLKQLLLNDILPNEDLSDIFKLKSKILYILSYGYTFQENEATSTISEFMREIDDFYDDYTEGGVLQDYYTIYLGQKFWLTKFTTPLEDTLDAFNLAMKKASHNPFLQNYLYLIMSYSFVLRRDLVSLKFYIDQLQNNLDEYPNAWLLFHYHLVDSLYWYYQGNYVESIKIAQKGLEIGEQHAYSSLPRMVNQFVINAGPTKIKVANLVRYLQKRLDIYDQVNYSFGKAVILGHIAQMYFNIKFYSNYLNYVEEEIKVIETHNFTELAIYRYFQMGEYYLIIKNDAKKALSYYTKTHQIANYEAMEDSFLHSLGHTGFAHHYEFTGKLDNAINHYKKSVDSPETLAHLKTYAMSHSGIAMNLTNQGNFSKAYETLKQATDIFYLIRHVNYTNWVESLLNMAILNIKLNRIREAREILEQVIKLSEDPHHPVSKMISIRARLEQFKLMSQLKSTTVEEMEVYHKELELYYRRHTELRPVVHYLDLILAIKLKHRPRLEHKIEALKLYRQLTTFDFPFDIKVEIYLSLLEILGLEYKIINHPNVKTEIMSKLDEFYKMGTGTINFYIIILYFVLYSKIEQIDHKFRAADGYLQTAETICEDNNLTHLYDIVKKERDDLNDLLSAWDYSIQNNQLLLDQIKDYHLDSYIQKMLNISDEDEVEDEEILAEEVNQEDEEDKKVKRKTEYN